MYKIIPINSFKKWVLQYIKKYPNIISDIEKLETDLLKNPHTWINLWNNTYKIRIKNSDLNKWKSSWYRVITYVIDKNKNIKLLKIYSKNDLENVSDKELKELLKEADNS